MQSSRNKDGCSGITLANGHSDGEPTRETHSSAENQWEPIEPKHGSRVYYLVGTKLYTSVLSRGMTATQHGLQWACKGVGFIILSNILQQNYLNMTSSA